MSSAIEVAMMIGTAHRPKIMATFPFLSRMKVLISLARAEGGRIMDLLLRTETGGDILRILRAGTLRGL
jgi:hypothetical protein